MSIVNLNQIYYYDQIKSDAYLLEHRYPDLIHTRSIGTSLDGRDILLLTVGQGKKNVLLTAGVHGRENINPPVLMRMMEYYCEEALPCLQEYTFYAIPLLNPDGYMIALRGFNIIRHDKLRLIAKGVKIPYQEWKYNARGIDINRNFPAGSWKPKYPMDYPASENETKALMQLIDTVSFLGYIDYHSRGKEIYYYRTQMSKAYNQKQKLIADRLADDTGYSLVPEEEEIGALDSGGNTVHYFSEATKQPAFTIETVEDEAIFPLMPSYQETAYQEILFSPLILLY